MTDKELRRLKREELLEMLISQSKEVEELRAEVSELKKKLDDRQICLDKAGSIAEASVLLNGVFEAAQAAAQQYLENIQRISSQQDAISRVIKEQSAKEAAQIRQEAEAYSQKVHAEADAYWKQVAARAAKLLEDQNSLREMINSAGKVR